MKTFIVGHIDWFNHDLILERISAINWQHAVAAHSKFPWTGTVPTTDPETFKQQCFDGDCMMDWIEVQP